MSTPLRVLILEDRASDAELVLHELRRAGYSPDWRRVEDRAEYLAQLDSSLDVILADYSLPQFDALTALELLKERELDIPFIIVSGSIGEDIAVSAMNKGAEDYLLKDRPARLGQAVGLALERKRHRQERVQAEDALRESEERFRATFEQAAVGMALVGLDGRWLLVNQKLCDLVAYTREDLLARAYKDLTHPDDLNVDIDHLRHLLAGEIKSYSIEKRYLRRDGTVFWGNLTGSLVCQSTGHPKYFITVIKDISEQLKFEAALRESEERYRLLFESNPHPMWVYDQATLEFLEVNDAAVRHFGYSREEFLGITVRDVRPPDDVTALVQNVAGAGSTLGADGTWPHRKKNGEMVEVEITSHALSFDDRASRLVLALDVTERKRAEKEQRRLQAAIEKSALEWQLTFDAIESPVLILDPSGRITKSNRAARELVGESTSEMEGLNIGKLNPAPLWQRAAEGIGQVRRNRAAATCQATDEASGRTWDLAISIANIPQGYDERIILVVREITELVQLQGSLHRSETMSLLGSLVSGVAHEVRNPLFGISSTLDAFEARFGAREEFHRYLEILREQVSRLNGLMKDLFDYGRPISPELFPDSIGDTITQAVQACTPLAKDAKVKIVKQVPARLSLIPMDQKRLPQVFLNLLDNAIRHSPPGSSVSLEVEEVCQEEKHWIVCTVKDSGPGFQEADLPRIFEPFFTRRRGGTGLGLSIVHRIIDAHGGKISVNNRPEGGASIVIKFPVPVALINNQEVALYAKKQDFAG
ncbi:MAG TPA: PAS domain S-box protein [Blastocatellia bacterium]|nr:PAS domain S-box protein [Blastocatellia bacterium]